ncbi:hypothetical protein ABGB17_02015 [Sphaerisporangium sp. B11E5]|uniref:hypothetical protein n=1 Tax=Sphaerisporangium sp. B11E5 TaxID=3153563 RepID=UPI00325C933F
MTRITGNGYRLWLFRYGLDIADRQARPEKRVEQGRLSHTRAAHHGHAQRPARLGVAIGAHVLAHLFKLAVVEGINRNSVDPCHGLTSRHSVNDVYGCFLPPAPS